jgi:hypothetical protein
MVVSNVEVYGLEKSIKASKYPMSVDIDKLNSELTPRAIALAQCEKGTGHDNWLNGIIVQFDLTLTVKAWVEAERYHFFDFVSSQSTMHKIAKFDLDKSYNEYVDPRMIDIMKEKLNDYNADPSDEKYLGLLYSNPDGFKLTAGMTTNYRQLKTIYNQRKAHRLPEWKEFCAWIETLPHSELITRDYTAELKEKYADLMKQYHELELKCNELQEKADMYDEHMARCSNGRVFDHLVATQAQSAGLYEMYNELEVKYDAALQENISLKDLYNNVNEECDRLRDELAEVRNENTNLKNHLSEMYDECILKGADKEFGYVD